MRPSTSVAARRRGPNRILVALAAAWMILTLAIGGAVAADSAPGPEARSEVTGAAQP